MPEFFIVLFFGSIYLIRSIKNNIENAKRDEEIKTNISTRKAETARWISEVCDDNLYEEIEYYVHSIDNMKNVREVVGEAFEEAGISGMNYTEKDAIRVYLAYFGKLTRQDAEHGISVRSSKETIHEQNSEIANRRKFVLWIDSKLKEHGINEDMFIYTAPYKFFTLDYNEFIHGTYVWRPVIFPPYLKHVNNL